LVVTNPSPDLDHTRDWLEAKEGDSRAGSPLSLDSTALHTVNIIYDFNLQRSFP
jgi:hypothetical protein